MRLIQVPVILMIPLFCTVSCGRLLLPPLEIISVTPAGGLIDPAAVSAVEVSFNANPTPESAERAFGISEDGSLMDGSLNVTGNVLRFVPRAGFSSGKNYQINIGEAIETLDGSSLRSDYSVEYTTRAESDAPSVIAVSPENLAELASPPESVTVRFSEPVTKDSVARALSISPSISRVLSYADDGLSVTMIPKEPLALDTRYTIRVSDALSDNAGNSLDEEFVSSFVCGTDIVPPSYSMTAGSSPFVAGLLSSVERSAILRFAMAFDEELSENGAIGKIVIQPPLKMTVKQDTGEATGVPGTIVTISVNERPVWGKEYTLIVRKGIADMSGNGIANDAEYRFVCDREGDRPLTPIKAYLDVGRGIAENIPRYAQLSRASLYEDLIFPAEAWPVGETVTASMYVFVRGSAESNGITRLSAMKCISFDTTNSCMTARAVRMETDPASGPLCDPIRALVDADADLAPNGGNTFVIKVDMEIMNRENRGLIRLGVLEGLRDDIGNESESEWSVTMDKS